MNLDLTLRSEIQKAVASVFNQHIDNFQLQPTNQEFEGSHTLVCFPLTKISKKSPEETAKLVGEYLVSNSNIVKRFNVVKGFLNLVLSDSVWVKRLQSIYANASYGQTSPTGQEIMVEYSSPNTNKPLHLGHLRNNFLGWSVAEIYKANGYTVHKVQIINDRGIHICKSMAAWVLYGDGETPQNSGIKGDHLVGKYYVEFDKVHKAQLKNILKKVYEENDFSFFNSSEKQKLESLLRTLSNFTESSKEHELEVMSVINTGYYGSELEIIVETKYDNDLSWAEVLKRYQRSDEKVNKKERDTRSKELSELLELVLEDEKTIQDVKNDVAELAQGKTAIMKLASDMLRKWEQNDPETYSLWKTMNGWVYEGFNITYQKMGVDFDKLYFESETYLHGKEEVMKGVDRGVFFKKEDGSIWVDLTSDGLDQKVLLRSDGTSVYITQDIGTAILRFKDFPKIEGQVYTVGNEQEYHFKVLFLILTKLGYEWAKHCYHLSYGMVDLPSGKMKSREGTVVDADDLIDEMIQEAEKQTRELGKVEDLGKEEAIELFKMIGLGALKFFLLKVDPKKRMLFDPNESIQLQGFTGPFIQYTHARIKAIMRKAASIGIHVISEDLNAVKTLEPAEREIIQVLNAYETRIKDAAKDHSPAIIANYVYELAKEYNQFYQTIPIFSETDQTKLKFRVALSGAAAGVIKKGMNLLGIQVPERM